MLEGDYVYLTLVPERYTGYAGHSAHRVWRAIYEENCFGLSELNILTGKSAAFVTLPDTLTDVLREPIDGEYTNEECLEKRVYYKIISGTCFKRECICMSSDPIQVSTRQYQRTYVQTGSINQLENG